MAKKAKIEKLPPFSAPYYGRPIRTSTAREKYTKEENQPYFLLKKAIADTKPKAEPGQYVAHWFQRDLRQNDNRGLFEAKKLAKKLQIPLVTFWVFCVEDFYAHGVSGHQLQFRLDSLSILKKDLAKLNIPLHVVDVEKKADLGSAVLKFLQQQKINHVLTNLEYEVDELRLATEVLEKGAEKGIEVKPLHDSCVVEPGLLKTKSSGKHYAVFTPYWKMWCDHLNLLDDALPDYLIDFSNKTKLEGDDIPRIPDDWKLTKDQKKFYDSHWHAGEHAALKELDQFISDKISDYGELRNEIDTNATAHMSHHLALGTIGARTVVRKVIESGLAESVDDGDDGAVEWIRQVAWRDFYRNIVAHWPYVVMNKPFQLDYEGVEWEYNSDHFEKWCQGRTGYPIVDAAMRQLNHTGYMHNRGRMIVASFLSKHLLIDWRYGERYFLEHLIDGDFASNNGGWGFSSGLGVDPQPYFRVFNPWTQADRYDPDGDYIRQWVPELRKIKGAGVQNPYDKGHADEAKKAGYPEPIVDHKTRRQEAIDRFKAAKN